MQIWPMQHMQSTVFTATLQVLSDSSASEVWKLQLLQLLVPDWLLLPEQVVQLLGVFDK